MGYFLYVDPARGFVPIELVLTYDGVTRKQLQIDYACHDECGWFVTSWRSVQFNESGKSISSMSAARGLPYFQVGGNAAYLKARRVSKGVRRAPAKFPR